MTTCLCGKTCCLGKTVRELFSVGNQLGEMLITTEMTFGKGNQMSIEESPCSVKGTTISNWQKVTLAPCQKNNSWWECLGRKESVEKR